MAKAAIAALRSFFARVNLVTPRHAGPTWLGEYACDALPDALRRELGVTTHVLEPYAALARGWHAHGSAFVPDYEPYVRSLIDTGALASDSALDLACGTGITTAALASIFRRVCALDISPHMLREAKDHLRSCRNVEFIKADFRSFSMGEQVDLVISSGDSLNYVHSTSDLGDVFECVAGALRPGGLFLFDLQSEQSFRRCSRVVTCFRSGQFEWVQVHAYDPGTRIDNARAVTPEGFETHRRVYLSANDVGEAARRVEMRTHEPFNTPAMRFFAWGGGRDFYAFRR